MDKLNTRYAYMSYPHFDLHTRGGIMPNIILPPDYLALVPGFYRSGGKEEVEKYKEDLLKQLAESNILSTEINLRWDDRRGLVNISIGIHGGLDLDETGWYSFCPHNISTRNGFAGFCVATKYIWELLKERE